MVLLPKVISQPLVPNHLKLTPAAPGPPPAGAGSAPSATPGRTSDPPTLSAAAPATRPPKNPRRDNGDRAPIPSVSMKHMAVSPSGGRQGEKRAHHVPQLTPAQAERDRVRGAGQDDELSIRVRQAAEELEEVVLRRDAVVLAPDHEDRSLDPPRVDHREIRRHVEVGPGRNRVAEWKLGVGQSFGHGRIRRARLVAGEDGSDHVAPPGAPVVRAVVVDLLGALAKRGRALSRPGEGLEDDPVDSLRPCHGEPPPAHRPRRPPLQLGPPLAPLPDDDLARGLEILHPARDVGITGGAGPHAPGL